MKDEEIEVEVAEIIEEFLQDEAKKDEDDTYEPVSYVIPTPEETIEWLRNLWDTSFEPVYSEMQANGNYWSAGMQIETHNQCVRDHLDSMVRSGVLTDDESDKLYREIEQ